MSLADRFKKTMRDAGRLTRKGQLKLERMEAEAKLRDSHRELGQHVAARLIDRGEEGIPAGDIGIGVFLDSVRTARRRLEELTEEEASI